MNTLTIYSKDIGILTASAACCGSLSFPHDLLHRLKHALVARDGEEAQIVAERIVEHAVPEEDTPHLQRAVPIASCDGTVSFRTPGGVIIRFGYKHDGDFCLEVAFGRDSKYLGTEMLSAAMWKSGADRTVECFVDEVFFFLPQAFAIAAAELVAGDK